MIKLFNGDAYSLIKDIPDHSIDLIYTDIPYLLIQAGGKHDKGKISLSMAKLVYGDLKDIKDGIDYSILDEFVRVMKYIYIYMWCSKEQIPDIIKYFMKNKDVKLNILVWCKTNPTPATNGTWLPDVEYCLLFKDSKYSPKYNDGYDLKSKWYISSTNKEDKDNYNHPAIKPLDLVIRHLKHSCKGGELILDPFAGSGTTLLAAKRLGLSAIGFELDKKYYDIANDRLNGINQKGELNLFDLE